jgi:pimeloyl-ACP methyl ester carboxylesterase
MLMPKRSSAIIGLLFAVTLAPWSSAVATGSPVATASQPAPMVVQTKPCPDSVFTCMTLRVPRDHFAAAGGPTFDVTFGLLRASISPRKGVLVTVTGGPGTAGLASADSYTAAFDPRIPEQYDIVFFDQRGVGQSEALQCPGAALAFYTTPALPTVSAAQASAYARASKAFASDCITETGEDTSNLPYFSTRQAVEDLEAFRVWLTADKLDLYGESYGTQYVQTYAAAHPDHLHALFVDGVVDLTLTGTEYYAEDVHAYDEALALTLDRCTQSRACHRDALNADVLALYDTLAKQLGEEAASYDFIDERGSAQRRTFGLGDLETAAAGYATSTFDRMLLQRAMAFASRGEFLPLARLSYISIGQDPETLAAVPDPTWSDAMFYAVECMDYAYGSGSAADRRDAYLAAGVAAHVSEVRLGSIFYGDLPCAYWPSHPPSEVRPGYLTDTPFPVFVLNSSVDPATPFAGALRVYHHLDDAYLIVQPGGPHVIFGRGLACVDNPVTNFLVKGRRPAHRETICPFVGSDPYVPIPAVAVGDYKSTLAAMTAMDDEINYSADWQNWDGVRRLDVGCLDGGWIRYSPSADGFRVDLRDCAFSSGLPLTGKGSINDDGSFSLSVTTVGGRKLTYLRTVDGHRSATGTLPG